MKTNSGNRWLVVLGTIIVQMGLGTIYTWSLFNQPLVTALAGTSVRLPLHFQLPVLHWRLLHYSQANYRINGDYVV